MLSERLLEGEVANSIHTGAYCKARDRLPLVPLQQAVEASGAVLHQQADPTWLFKGHNLLVTDGSTLIMPDTPKIRPFFPSKPTKNPD